MPVAEPHTIVTHHHPSSLIILPNHRSSFATPPYPSLICILTNELVRERYSRGTHALEARQ
eukprot:5419424-Prymnesium_polylepis.1